MCIEGKEIEKNYSACIMEEKCDVRVDEEKERGTSGVCVLCLEG